MTDGWEQWNVVSTNRTFSAAQIQSRSIQPLRGLNHKQRQPTCHRRDTLSSSADRDSELRRRAICEFARSQAALAFALHLEPAMAAKTQPKRPQRPRQKQRPPGFESKMQPRPQPIRGDYRGSGKLVDKVAIITGGDSGIGRAVAAAF